MKNYHIMYLATKFDHICEYVSYLANSEESAIISFKKEFPNANIVEISE